VEQGLGQPGRFTLQPILDKGIEEYIRDVDVDELDVLLTLLRRSEHAMFGLKRKVRLFGAIDLD
jgi:hypothetical protein